MAALAFAIVFAFLGIRSSSALASNTVSISNQGGQRSAFLTPVTFSSPIIAGDLFLQTGSATLYVDDSSGTNLAWSVEIAVEPSPGEVVSLAPGNGPALI